MCSFSYIFSVLISTKRNCWRSINSFAGSISFSNEEKEDDDDASEDDARMPTAFRAKAFTLGLLLPLDVAAPFREDTIADVKREQRLRCNRGAFTRATVWQQSRFSDEADVEVAESGFATVKDIVFIFFFFFALLLLFSAYEKMTKTRDKNGAFTALKSST